MQALPVSATKKAAQKRAGSSNLPKDSNAYSTPPEGGAYFAPPNPLKRQEARTSQILNI